MSSVNSGFLEAIEHQKQTLTKRYKERILGRTMRNEGDLSIAADRGILRMQANSNSIGYNSKMKILNDKIAIEIMNKYKTSFQDKVSRKKKGN